MNKNIAKAVILILITGSSYWLFTKLLAPRPANIPDTRHLTKNSKFRITHKKQLPGLLPFDYLLAYRKWGGFDPLYPQLATAIYNSYTFTVASSKPIDKLIRSAIAQNLYPKIPKSVIFYYLKIGRYDINGKITNSSLPYFNFSLFGYQPRRPQQNNRVLHVAKILLGRGANINSVDHNSGRSSLHEAILMNHSEVVSFLLRNKADASLKVHQPKSKFHGMDALQFAEFMEKAAPGENYAKIIKTLTLHKLKKKN